MQDRQPPLAGVLVVDLSRMLPGAVLARQLLDLGARLIKVEEPGIGDLLRLVPPQVGGVGAGFAALLRGAESVCLDLRDAGDQERVRRLAQRADVLVESFRPGTLERYGLGADALLALNPRLVFCSLSAFGRQAGHAERVGHDLNFTALTGALRVMASTGVPAIQLADVTAGLLAATSITAALLARARDGRGGLLDQPLLAGPLPFLTWSFAELAAGGGGALETVLAGHAPCYGVYRCADDLDLAVAAIEPKFWTRLVAALGLPQLADAAFCVGAEGERVTRELAGAFASRPRSSWLELAAEQGLPLSAVNDLDAAAEELRRAGLMEQTPVPEGGTITTPGPFLPSLGRTPDRPAPTLGEHTEAVLCELGQ